MTFFSAKCPISKLASSSRQQQMFRFWSWSIPFRRSRYRSENVRANVRGCIMHAKPCLRTARGCPIIKAWYEDIHVQPVLRTRVHNTHCPLFLCILDGYRPNTITTQYAIEIPHHQRAFKRCTLPCCGLHNV